MSPFSARRPRCTNSVASPPSSRIMFGMPPSPHSNSLRGVVPVVLQALALEAKTGMPAAAIAAAAWSCVE